MGATLFLASITTPIRDLVATPEFGVGWRIGLVALGVAAVVGIAWRLLAHAPAPVGGILLAGAGCAAIADALELPDAVVTAVVVLAVGGLVDDLLELPLPLRLLLPVPGAWLMATGVELPGPGWVATAVGFSIVVGAALAADLDRRYRESAPGTALVVMSVLGIYTTVPDTEYARTLVGASLPLLVVGWPLRLARLGSAGAFASVGVLVWVVALDGRGRATAVVGGLACLGILAAEPVANLLRRPGPPWPLDLFRRPWLAAIPAGLLHLGLVFLAARVAGMRTTVAEATAVAGTVLVAGVIAVVALDRLVGGGFAAAGRAEVDEAGGTGSVE